VEGMTRKSLNLVQRTMGAVAEHVAILDETSRIVGINAAWARFGDDNGLRYGEHGLGTNYLEVCDWARGVHAEGAAEVAANIRRLLSERRCSFTCEYPCHSQVEQRWFEVRGLCFEYRKRCYVVLAHQNITPMKQAALSEAAAIAAKAACSKLEAQVSQRTLQLEESLKGTERLLYHMEHNLRAPLRAMVGFSQLLLVGKGTGLDTGQKNLLCRIQQASTTLDQLLNGMLEYGRLGLEQPSCTSINLGVLLDEVLDMLAREQESSRAEVTIMKPMPQVCGDQRILRRILCELLLNALKFVPAGAVPHVRIWAESREQKVRLMIQDNGIGIFPEHQKCLFRVFQRLPQARSYPGTGIGLAIAKHGLEHMHGHIGLESNPGHGSCFWVELPGQ